MAVKEAYRNEVMADFPPDTATIPTPTRAGRPLKGQEKINIAEAFKLRLRGWSFEQLAEKYKCVPTAVSKALEKLTSLVPDPHMREAYAQSKAEILESVQLTMMASLIQPAKIQKATLGNLAYASSKLDEMIRLERGQSTKNINVLSTIIDGAHGKLFTSKQMEQAAPQAQPQAAAENAKSLIISPVTTEQE